MLDGRGTILIGFDDSEEAEDAIQCAARLLAPRRAIVAHVWESPAELLLHVDVERLEGEMKGAAEELDEGNASEAEAIAARGAELAVEAGLDAVPIALRARPRAGPTLVKLADEHDVAAVVVGSRGLGGVKSALLGSVSSNVVHHARRPVLVVSPRAPADRAEPVLIAYDGSADADNAIAATRSLLQAREAIVATVWSSYEEISPAGLAGAPVVVVSKAAEELDRGVRLAAEQTAERGALLATMPGRTIRAEAIHGTGQPWRGLLDASVTHRAAAIVVGSRGRSALGVALLGSVSRSLIHHAPVPVLVVRNP
jgi:nucleotide-binding universal stress UspA family protein